MKNEKVSCKEVISHICENLGEDLDSPKCVSIRQHLDECGCCQSYYKSIDKTISFYKNYNADLTDDVHKRLMDSLGLTE